MNVKAPFLFLFLNYMWFCFLVVSFHGFSCLVCNHEDRVVMLLLSPIKIEMIVVWHIVSFEVIAMLVDS